MGLGGIQPFGIHPQIGRSEVRPECPNQFHKANTQYVFCVQQNKLSQWEKRRALGIIQQGNNQYVGVCGGSPLLNYDTVCDSVPCSGLVMCHTWEYLNNKGKMGWLTGVKTIEIQKCSTWQPMGPYSASSHLSLTLGTDAKFSITHSHPASLQNQHGHQAETVYISLLLVFLVTSDWPIDPTQTPHKVSTMFSTPINSTPIHI